MQAFRIDVNRFDSRGWRSWGCGHEFDAAVADGLIRQMGPDPERRELEAAGLAVPSKLFRKVPVVSTAVNAPEAGVDATRTPDRLLEVIESAHTRLKRAQDAWADVERNAIIEEVILALDAILDSVTHGPRHYYEIRSPAGKRLGWGLISEATIAAGGSVAMMSEFPAGTTFKSKYVSEDEARRIVQIETEDWTAGAVTEGTA